MCLLVWVGSARPRRISSDFAVHTAKLPSNYDKRRVFNWILNKNGQKHSPGNARWVNLFVAPVHCPTAPPPFSSSTPLAIGMRVCQIQASETREVPFLNWTLLDSIGSRWRKPALLVELGGVVHCEPPFQRPPPWLIASPCKQGQQGGGGAAGADNVKVAKLDIQLNIKFEHSTSLITSP